MHTDLDIDALVNDFLAGVALPESWAAVVADHQDKGTTYSVFTSRKEPLTLTVLKEKCGDMVNVPEATGMGDELVWLSFTNTTGKLVVHLAPTADRAALKINSLFAGRLIDLDETVSLLSQLV